MILSLVVVDASFRDERTLQPSVRPPQNKASTTTTTTRKTPTKKTPTKTIMASSMAYKDSPPPSPSFISQTDASSCKDSVSSSKRNNPSFRVSSDRRNKMPRQASQPKVVGNVMVDENQENNNKRYKNPPPEVEHNCCNSSVTTTQCNSSVATTRSTSMLRLLSFRLKSTKNINNDQQNNNHNESPPRKQQHRDHHHHHHVPPPVTPRELQKKPIMDVKPPRQRRDSNNTNSLSISARSEHIRYDKKDDKERKNHNHEQQSNGEKHRMGSWFGKGMFSVSFYFVFFVLPVPSKSCSI
jgi:hypothetical protein